MRILWFLAAIVAVASAGCRGSQRGVWREEDFAGRDVQWAAGDEWTRDVWMEWARLGADSLRVVVRADSVRVADGTVVHGAAAEVAASNPRGERKAEGSAEGARQQAAVMETEAQGSRREETEERRGPRWYEAGLMRLGQGVAIAGLMWMLFLYLKRKK